jgi:hypothetical protein
MTRHEAITTIRQHLQSTTGLYWSVAGGQGAQRESIRITAPPTRLTKAGKLSAQDKRALALAMGLSEVKDDGYTLLPVLRDEVVAGLGEVAA